MTIKQIELAIEEAIRHQSILSDLALQVPMLGSIKIRHLMNNLGSLCTNFLEVGSHRGGSFVSTTYGNGNIRIATAIDDYSENFHDGDAKADFMANAKEFCDPNTTVVQISKDCFSIDPKNLGKDFDLYLYDGDHSYESQRKAVSYFLDAMADEFIMVIDDYSWEKVTKGTQDGLADIADRYEVIFSSELTTPEGGEPNLHWHNGTFVALLKKKA